MPVISVPVLAVSAFAWFQGYKSLWVCSLAVSRARPGACNVSSGAPASCWPAVVVYQIVTLLCNTVAGRGGGAVLLHAGAPREGLRAEGPDSAFRLNVRGAHWSELAAAQLRCRQIVFKRKHNGKLHTTHRYWHRHTLTLSVVSRSCLN